MLPRAPQQKLPDRYPDKDEPGRSFESDRKLQLSYEAEVIVYRALEKLNEDLIVLHGFECKHFQYHLGDSSHDENKCDKCKTPYSKESENDFIIIAQNYFVVIEVKSRHPANWHIGEKSHPGKDPLADTFKKSLQQRKKMVELIERFCKELIVRQFTAYPNFEQAFEDEFQLSAADKSTIIFKEDIVDIQKWWNENVSGFVKNEPLSPEFQNKHEEVRNMLLAIWCTDGKTCKVEKCSIGRCILDIDKKLRSGKFTIRKKNPEVVPTPDFVKDHLGIDNLTKEQYDLINSTDQILWINGPAGAGKTVVLMARILKLVQSSIENKVVLFTVTHSDREVESLRYHQETLEKAGITNVQIVVDLSSELLDAEISDKLREYQVVVVSIKYFSFSNKEAMIRIRQLVNLLTSLPQVNVFIDDAQIMYYWLGGQGADILFSAERLKQEASYQLCVTCDMAQHLLFGLANTWLRRNNVKKLSNIEIKSLTKNLRNTCNLSKTLSEIRSRIVDFYSTSVTSAEIMFPLQARGHYIHGPKIVMHVLYHFDKNVIKEILTRKLDEFCNDEMIDVKTDLGIIYSHQGRENISFILQDIENYGSNRSVDLKPRFLIETSSMEWPAVIVLIEPLRLSTNPIYRTTRDSELQLLINLYFAMSRARVQCTVVMFPEERDKLSDSYTELEGLINLNDSVEIRRYP